MNIRDYDVYPQYIKDACRNLNHKDQIPTGVHM